MGLTVNVYRNAGPDCTAGGISATADRICLVNVTGPNEPSVDAPAAMVTDNALGNKIVVPARAYVDGDTETGRRIQYIPVDGWPMFGGNYAASCDSRFARAAGIYGAVPIHDRYER